MTRKINVNAIYRHFKGNTYKVITLAKDSETLEDIVVYKDVNSDKVWIRPLDEFISKVDKEKYPDIEQVYRFEEVK